jgi:hypothetical protein
VTRVFSILSLHDTKISVYPFEVEIMNAEKASTLRLLREGIGNAVRIVETHSADAAHAVRALLPDCATESRIPVLFLLTSLAFLEASPAPSADAAADREREQNGDEDEFREVDGWTPADFLMHLRFEGSCLRVSLGEVRGRAVHTALALSDAGDLRIETVGRGQSASRWLSFVEGRRHLQTVSAESELG